MAIYLWQAFEAIANSSRIFIKNLGVIPEALVGNFLNELLDAFFLRLLPTEFLETLSWESLRELQKNILQELPEKLTENAWQIDDHKPGLVREIPVSKKNGLRGRVVSDGSHLGVS